MENFVALIYAIVAFAFGIAAYPFFALFLWFIMGDRGLPSDTPFFVTILMNLVVYSAGGYPLVFLTSIILVIYRYINHKPMKYYPLIPIAYLVGAVAIGVFAVLIAVLQH